MRDVRHPRIASALLLALFWGSGFLVGTSAQRVQAPEGTAAPMLGLVNGAAAETGTLDPKPDLAWALECYGGIPPRCVLVEEGSDYVVERGGVLNLPLNCAAGVYTTTSVNHSLVTAVVPVTSTATFLLPSKDGFY